MWRGCGFGVHGGVVGRGLVIAGGVELIVSEIALLIPQLSQAAHELGGTNASDRACGRFRVVGLVLREKVGPLLVGRHLCARAALDDLFLFLQHHNKIIKQGFLFYYF
jgi:hypothetical protein